MGSANGGENQMNLDTLLATIRSRGLVLLRCRSRLVIWAPHTQVPWRVQSAIKVYQVQLEELITVSDVRVCPGQDHRSSWKCTGAGRHVCVACKELRRNPGCSSLELLVARNAG